MGATRDLKPIETRYAEYLFRSRLEARWAVFFDHLGIEWEYEKEGYDLGEAGWYLPDFWLPGLKTWVEIKPMYRPELEHETEMAIRKLWALRDASGGTSAIAVFGDPVEYGTFAVFQECGESSGGFVDTSGIADLVPSTARFMLCPECGPYFAYYGWAEKLGSHPEYIAVCAEWEALPSCTCQPAILDKWADEDGVVRGDNRRKWLYDASYHFGRIMASTNIAAQAARSARFEHGQRGAA